MQRVLLCILCVLLSSCENGPRVTICLVDSERQALQCSDPDGRTFQLPLKEGDNYVCLPPHDAEKLLRMFKEQRGSCLPVIGP
jgi:hypothetical protein